MRLNTSWKTFPTLSLAVLLGACAYTTTPMQLTWPNGFTTIEQTSNKIDPLQIDTATVYAKTCGPASQIPPTLIARGDWIAGDNGIACLAHDDSHAAQRGILAVIGEEAAGPAAGGVFYLAGQRARRPDQVNIGASAASQATGGAANNGGVSATSQATGGAANNGGVTVTQQQGQAQGQQQRGSLGDPASGRHGPEHVRFTNFDKPGNHEGGDRGGNHDGGQQGWKPGEGGDNRGDHGGKDQHFGNDRGDRGGNHEGGQQGNGGDQPPKGGGKG